MQYIYTYIHIHTHTYTYTHTYIHTYIHTTSFMVAAKSCKLFLIRALNVLLVQPIIYIHHSNIIDIHSFIYPPSHNSIIHTYIFEQCQRIPPSPDPPQAIIDPSPSTPNPAQSIRCSSLPLFLLHLPSAAPYLLLYPPPIGIPPSVSLSGTNDRTHYYRMVLPEIDICLSRCFPSSPSQLSHAYSGTIEFSINLSG